MSPVQASCPACGASVKFTVDSSVVTVCAYCRSVVARGDRALEDLGKVADLAQTESPLEVGMKGRFQGVPFHLTGRAQFRHPAGGVWDEWYAAFTDGRWGWLAEAQGRFYMTFETDVPERRPLPEYEGLQLGSSLRPVRGGPLLTIVEKGWATTASAEGEIPYRLEPDQTFAYADLSGGEGEFATIDYGSSPPSYYLGHEVSLDDLGVPASAKAGRREAPSVEAMHLSCPNCGGGLDLRAPDKSERVTCPNCGGLLDIQQGHLKFLKALEPPPIKPLLALGSVGAMPEGKMTVLGFLRRSVVVEKVRYYWQEYLLYQPRIGFRWLVHSDNHWNYVVPLPPGKARGSGTRATYDGKDYKIFQRAPARVDNVQGEFYWKVSAGEKVDAYDYVNPPEMLSKEVSTDDTGAGEINWSHGVYMTPREVEKAFDLKKPLPRPSTIAPNQPFAHKRIYPYWIVAVGIVFMIYIFQLGLHASPRKLFERTYQVQAAPGDEPAKVVFGDEPLDLKGMQNIEVSAVADVDNSWVHVAGDFIDEETGLIQSFDVPVEYYHGVDGGESWSEGGRSNSTYVSAVPAGKYSLRLEFYVDRGTAPTLTGAGPTRTITVTIRQGVARFTHMLIALILISLIPLGVVGYHIYFENRRWQDSNTQ